MASRNENLNRIREKMAQADKKLDALSDEQLEAIAGGYTYGDKPKYIVGELVDGYIPLEGWDIFLAAVFNIDNTERFSGVVTGYTQKDGKWVYDVMTSSGKEYQKVEEQYLTLK